MKFVIQSKTKQNKSTEIFPPLILKPTCMYMLRCIAGSVADPDQVVSGSGSRLELLPESATLVFLLILFSFVKVRAHQF